MRQRRTTGPGNLFLCVLVMLTMALMAGCNVSVQVSTGTSAKPEESAEAETRTQETTAASQNKKKKKTNAAEAEPEGTKLAVHYLDVGQGNSILLESEDHYMLIDGGPSDHSSYVVSYLKQEGVETLDYLIVTHYDSDHVTGTVGVLNNFPVDTVLNSGYEATTKIYKSFVTARDNNGCQVEVPSVGDSYTLGEASFTVVCPVNYDYDDVNNNSIGVKICCGDTSFLILGDAELESEYDFLDAAEENGTDLTADVYMASHHGSYSSSSERLLEAVNPSVVVISCGLGNSYGHPAEDAINRFKDKGLPVYRTDIQGTILAWSDGSTITFDTEPCNDYTPGDQMTLTEDEKEASLAEASGTAETSKVSQKESTQAKETTKASGKKSSSQEETTKASKKTGSTEETTKSSGSSKKETTEAAESKGEYIGNVNSKTFHKSTCSHLPKEENREYFKTRKAAIKAGYNACGYCNP